MVKPNETDRSAAAKTTTRETMGVRRGEAKQAFAPLGIWTEKEKFL